MDIHSGVNMYEDLVDADQLTMNWVCDFLKDRSANQAGKLGVRILNERADQDSHRCRDVAHATLLVASIVRRGNGGRAAQQRRAQARRAIIRTLTHHRPTQDDPNRPIRVFHKLVMIMAALINQEPSRSKRRSTRRRCEQLQKTLLKKMQTHLQARIVDVRKRPGGPFYAQHRATHHTYIFLQRSGHDDLCEGVRVALFPEMRTEPSFIYGRCAFFDQPLLPLYPNGMKKITLNNLHQGPLA